MRKSCYGWASDPSDLLIIMNQMIAEDVQVISITDNGSENTFIRRLLAFGIAEYESQLERVSERVKNIAFLHNAGFYLS
jgi:hypothetical protein